MKKLINDKGSLTIESILIMIYVIGIVFLLIHLSNDIYQKVYMQALADEAVEMAQRYWTNTGKNFKITKKDFGYCWFFNCNTRDKRFHKWLNREVDDICSRCILGSKGSKLRDNKKSLYKYRLWF